MRSVVFLRVMLVLTVLIYQRDAHAVQNTTDSLVPDLDFRYRCIAQKSVEQIDDAVEEFLVAHGFSVLNRRRLQISSGNKPIYEQSILALKNQTMIGLTKVPGMRMASVYINSPPPTSHDDGLERELIEFFGVTLDCLVIDVQRNENTSASNNVFNRLLSRVKEQLKESQTLPH